MVHPKVDIQPPERDMEEESILLETRDGRKAMLACRRSVGDTKDCCRGFRSFAGLEEELVNSWRRFSAWTGGNDCSVLFWTVFVGPVLDQQYSLVPADDA